MPREGELVIVRLVGGPLDGTTIEVNGAELPGQLVMPAVIGSDLLTPRAAAADLLDYRLKTGTVGSTPTYELVGPA